MMAVLLLPLLVCLIGALVYALAARPKLVELGRISFACGLLVTLFYAATHLVRL